jgi:hypothetical protein
MYRLKSTGTVMYEGELRQYLKDNNGPTFGQMTTEIMDAIGVDPVFEGPQPATSGPYEYVARQGVEQQSDGKWYTKYVVQTLDDDGKATKDVEVAKNVRDDRNRRLSETDWTQGKDIPDNISNVWATYRQELRDLPAQAGFPHNVTWPNKPE